MLKARPRVRRSFGGKDGIWWRKKTCPDSKTKSDIKNECGATPLVPSIGWDPDLCRPVYSMYSFSRGNNNDTSESSESEDDGKDDDADEPWPSLPDSPEILQQKSPVKRTSKCYRGFRKRSLSLFIDTDIATSLPAKKKNKTTIQQDYKMDSLASASSEPNSNCEDDAESPIDCSKDSNRPDRENCRTSVAPLSMKKRSQGRLKTVRTLDNADSQVFDFDATDEFDATPSKSNLLFQPNAKSSIDEARTFFDSLDATEKLTLDTSSTPITSSQVFRTSRRVYTLSPRLVQEYSDYVEAIEATGVAPLGIADYTKNRGKLSGRENALFDGFLEG